MIHELIYFDRYLLVLINRSWANPLFDFLMPLLRDAKNWIPLYLVIIAYTIIKYRKNAWVIILCAVMSVAVADRISAGIFKPLFERERPCHKEGVREQIILRKEGCGGQYGFVSSHAANHFALAVFLIMAWRRRVNDWLTWSLLLWAASICYAQVYVGVHYPADVFFGGWTGIFCGSLFARINKLILIPLYRNQRSQR